MKLNEAEMRMAYRIESTDPNAVLNKIYMTWRLSRNLATRDTAESLMAKLRGVRPFLSRKYDITKHPNYKFLSDFNLKNTFDI